MDGLYKCKKINCEDPHAVFQFIPALCLHYRVLVN